MKNLFRGLLVVTAFLATGLLSTSVSAKEKQQFKEIISDKLKQENDLLTEKNAIVFVSFSLDESGKVVILELNGSHREYIQFVRSRLMELDASSMALEPGRAYCYKINFSLM
jgi:hypothetical protein